MEEKKKLEIISGDGSSLNISPAYDHLDAARPKCSREKPTNIVIPKNQKAKDKEENEKDDDDDDDKKENN